MQSISRIAVVGGGTMGEGIALRAVRFGIPVVIKEANEAVAENVRASIERRLTAYYEKGILGRTELKELYENILVTHESSDCASADLAIEAVPENIELKKKIFSELDVILPAHAIIASNTSSIPIHELASATKRPEQVLGMHFFNPPTSMPLIELIRGMRTSDETVESIFHFTESTLQKIPILVKDRPGFLVNCLLMPYIGEALHTIEHSMVAPSQIDGAAKEFGWPMGPFEMLDMVGIATTQSVAQFMAQSYHFDLSTVLDNLLSLGRFGEREASGVQAGFYVFDGVSPSIDDLLLEWYLNRADDDTAEAAFERMMALMMNEAAKAVEENVASKSDIELGAQMGIACPGDGLLHLIDTVGAGELAASLRECERARGKQFAPCQLLVSMAERNERFFKAK